MDSVILNASVNSYTIQGLTPSTQYNITMFAINQCGNGPEMIIDSATGPIPSTITTTTAINPTTAVSPTTAIVSPTPTNKPSE